MKRKTVKLILIITGIALLVVPFFFMKHHHSTASDYKKVLKVVDVELPEIIEVQYTDNYDRGASRWDCLEHFLRFESSLSESTIQELERRCEKDSIGQRMIRAKGHSTNIEANQNGRLTYIFSRAVYMKIMHV